MSLVTRAVSGPLAEAGIQFLDIGDNPGCKSPDVPFYTPSGSPITQSIDQDNRSSLVLAKFGVHEADKEDPHTFLFTGAIRRAKSWCFITH